MKRFTSASAFIAAIPQWKAECTALGQIRPGPGEEEKIYCGFPEYLFDGKNEAGRGAFNAHVGLRFFQGLFLKDTYGVLMHVRSGTADEVLPKAKMHPCKHYPGYRTPFWRLRRRCDHDSNAEKGPGLGTDPESVHTSIRICHDTTLCFENI